MFNADHWVTHGGKYSRRMEKVMIKMDQSVQELNLFTKHILPV
jgi:hypothetical protein